ncbi:hypothetical protein [Zhongshania sp.]|uniref:hypothetical protein n=1 Tax=Zhongshania sp. TaxID=1971902 RepID=UPI0035622644
MKTIIVAMSDFLLLSVRKFLLVASLTTVASTAIFATAASTDVAAAGLKRTAAEGKKLGFVVTYFYYAMEQGETACPKGVWPITSTKEFLATKPPAEQQRLLQAENRKELFRRMIERGPNGENVCAEPLSAPDPQMYTLAGDRNDGLDLDGKTKDSAITDYTCPHKQYTDSQGRKGIDNQLGRVLACVNGLREKGTLVPYFTQAMRNGMWSMLIEISDVDNVKNDSSVRVDIYAGNENMVKNPSGEVMAGASLSPKIDPHLHRQFAGRIVNGVLETDVIADLFVPDIMTNRRPAFKIERPRLELKLLEDGTATGFLGGYISQNQYIAPSSADAEGELFTGLDCHAMYYAVHTYADGDRDPVTGKCSTLSTAFRIEAVPAFIVRPDLTPIPTFSQRAKTLESAAAQ